MRVVAMECFVVRIPFRFSFRHALAERRQADSVLLRVELAGGAVGWGEAVPRAYLTGESVESVVDDLRARWAPALRELDFPPRESPLPALAPLYAQAAAARRTAAFAAVDLAVIDAVARAADLPAARLLGLPARTVKLTAPLGGGGAKSVRRLARLFRWLGFTDFKLKVGMGDDDAARLRAAREVLPRGGRFDLRVDANAAWNPALARVRLREFAQFGVSSCEQPTPPAAGYDDWAAIAAATGCPLMADESLCTLDDARRLLAAGNAKADGAGAPGPGGAGLWNLRLAKNGGFSGLFAFRDLAAAAGVGLHLGALVGETALLAAAGRAAAGAADFRHVEYGFHRVLLKGDPFRGGPAGYRGIGAPLPERPGFGVRLLPEALARVTVRRERL